MSFLLQHTRFVQECKDAEPDVLFVGDSMVQLMQQFEVRHCLSPKRHYYHLIYFFKCFTFKLYKTLQEDFSLIGPRLWPKVFLFPLPDSLSTGVEGVILSPSCAQLRHRRRHHLQRAVAAAEWRAGEHPPQGEPARTSISANKHYAEIKAIGVYWTVLSTKTIKVVLRKNWKSVGGAVISYLPNSFRIYQVTFQNMQVGAL